MEQILAGWFPDTPKDIVSGDCKFSVYMCYTWIKQKKTQKKSNGSNIDSG